MASPKLTLMLERCLMSYTTFSLDGGQQKNISQVRIYHQMPILSA